MNNTYSFFSLKFLKAYLIQCRPYLLFISGIAGLSGVAIVEITNIDLWRLSLTFIPLFLGYGFGQALTDTWQIDTDAISAPYRPLSKGIISIKSVRVASISGLALSVVVLIYLNLWNIIFGILSVFGLITYSYFKRNFWFIGPFYNAWIVALLPIMGYLSINNTDLSSLLNDKLLLVFALSFMSYTNFVLIGYLKDISADRETGYRTFPVVFGWDKTVWAGDFILLITSVIVFMIVETRIGLIIAAFATVLTISGQLYAHFVKVKKELNAAFPIVMTVRSFILWHISIVLDNHSNWIFLLLLFYFIFEVVLFFRPEKQQI